MSAVTKRIAMWSGPRNISTAMMRSFENRPDCMVVDEPFYACYLAETGIDHPMKDEVIASQPVSWHQVAQELSVSACDRPIWYQKHMTHHMLKHVDLSWTRHLKHCFLIRDPFEVVNSYAQKRETVTAEDIGIVRQLELYDEISGLCGQEIPVVDAESILLDPEKSLPALCDALEIPFATEMLHWPAGRRHSDGVWAPHWYHQVEQSTGFEPWREREIVLDPEQQCVAEESLPAYRALLEKHL